MAALRELGLRVVMMRGQRPPRQRSPAGRRFPVPAEVLCGPNAGEWAWWGRHQRRASTNRVVIEYNSKSAASGLHNTLTCDRLNGRAWSGPSSSYEECNRQEHWVRYLWWKAHRARCSPEWLTAGTLASRWTKGWSSSL